jgi:hypothetical protein
LVAVSTDESIKSMSNSGGAVGAKNVGTVTVPGNVGLFLLPPEVPSQAKGPAVEKVVPIHSTLYLLRREIKDTGFGVGERVSEASLRGQLVKYRAFATAMLVFAGIDLLARIRRPR